MDRSIPAPVVTSAVVRDWLGTGAEIALIDVREEGAHGLGHPLLSTSIPYSRLELEFPYVVPRRETRVVLFDGADGIAAKAVRRLQDIGYSDLHILDGGIKGWQAAGFELFESTNVPSKAFAEFVEHECNTPSIGPDELEPMLRNKADLVLLDCRTDEEFTRFHIPNAVSCPGAELVRQFDDVVKSKDSLVVVTCAGRTRGIMGAQSLINAGVPNRVVALRGGTPGWLLADYKLEAGQAAPRAVSEAALARAADRGRDVVRHFDVRTIDGATLSAWAKDSSRTLHLFDVRTKEEFAQGHRENAIFVPGGQLVHTIDRWVGTRNARVVLTDDTSVRATLTAHWLQQMGWDVSVLNCPDRKLGIPARVPAKLKPVKTIEPAEAARWFEGGAAALYTDASAEYRRAHPQGSVWINRARLGSLPAEVLKTPRIIVFSVDGQLAHLAALDLMELSTAEVAVVAGGVRAWKDGGLPTEETPSAPSDAERIDFLFWNHERQLGNPDHMRSYLHWEANVLPKQIERDGTAGFRIVAPQTRST